MGVRTGGSEQEGEPLLAASLPSCFASACSSTFSSSPPYRSIRSISCGAPLADAAASRCLPAHSLFQKNRLQKRQPRVRNSSCTALERPGVAHVKESSATVATNAAAPPVAATPVGKAAMSHLTATATALAELPGSAAASSTSEIPAVAAKTGAGGVARTRAAATVRRTAATIAGAATALGKAAAAAVSTPLTAAATPGYAPLTSNTIEGAALAPAPAPAAETLPAAATATQAKAVVTAAVASTSNIPSNCLLTRWRTSLAFSDLPVAAAVRACSSEPGSTIGFSPAGTARRERQPLRRQQQQLREHEFHSEQQQRQPTLQRPEQLQQLFHKPRQWGQELQQGHTGYQQQKKQEQQEKGDRQQELGTQWPRKRQMKHKTINRKQQQQQRVTGEMPHRQQNARLQQKQRQHQASITTVWMLAFVCFCSVVLLHPVTAAAARRDLSRKSARNPLCSSAAIPVSAAAGASLLPSLRLRPCVSSVLKQHEPQQQQLEQHQQLRQQQWQRRKARLHASQHQRQLSDSEKETAGRPSRAEEISSYTHQELLNATTSPSSSSSPPHCSALAACPAAAASSFPPGLSTAAVHFMDPPPQGNCETGGAAVRWSARTLHATEPAGEGVGGGSSLRTAQKRLLKQRRLAACSGVRTPCTFLRQQKPIIPAPPSPTALQLVHLAATPSFDYFFLSSSLPRNFVRVPFYSGALSRSTAAHAAVPSDAFRSNRFARAATPSSAAGRCRTRAAPRPAASVTSRAATGIPGAALRAAALPTPQFTAAPTGAQAAATAAGQPTTGGNGEAGTGAEVFHFQAEVKRVLDIIVNSLYTDRDVFLRELISNAADACDKKRVLLQQQTPQQQQQQEQQEQQRQHQSVFRGSIRVRADREKNTLSIEDDGIGMTRAELISNLGTIAQSGTYRFLEQLRKEQAAASPFSAQKGSPASSDASLIGQFGVGFYSAFLVANKVEVYSAPWRRDRGRAPAATAAAGGNAATEAAEAAKRAAATKGDGEERAARDAAAVEEGELELWKWTSTCGQTFQLERVADAAAERRRWLEEGRALRAQFQKQKQQERLQQEGGAAEAGKQDGEKKDAEEEEEEDLGNWSGTRVVLHLKEDCDDYLEDYKLKELLRKYSEFVQLPIYIWSERIEYERVPDTQEAPGLLQQQRSNSSEGGVGRGEDVGGKAGEPAFSQLTPETMDEQLEHMQQQQRQGLAGDGAAAAAAGGSGGRFKTVTRRYYEWEHLNTQPPIWRRDEATLSDKDYVDFYKSTFKAYDDPLSFVHMKVEGQVEFNALLFVPGALPWELARNMFDEDSRGIRLYVKRVFINDKFADAVPRWLTFIRGVVDSDELPLNVGREILQKSRMLQVINKRLAMKAVEMIKKIKADGGEKWRRFWENYGKYLKVGAVEDKDNQEELASLVQFHSTASPHALTDLSSYISRMQARNAAVQRGEPASSGDTAAGAAAGRLLQPRQQQAIYYLAAENRRAAEESPALELPKALGYEVIFGTEPLDEFFLASLSINQYKGFQVVDVNKADLKLGAEKAEDSAGDAAAIRDAAAVGKHSQRGEPQLEQHDLMKQESIEAKRIQLGSLCEWLQQILGSRVHRVQITDRLFSSPAVLVQGDFGLSPTMQRYMKQQAAAQGVSEQELYGASLNQPILELNPYHPIVQRLDVLVRRDVTDSKAKEVALQLFDVASLQGGYTIENPGQFAKRIVDMMKNEADAALS